MNTLQMSKYVTKSPKVYTKSTIVLIGIVDRNAFMLLLFWKKIMVYLQLSTHIQGC